MNDDGPRTSTLSGRISYLSDAPIDRGRVHGSERFILTRGADGRMIQRAHCRIDDSPFVERDSVLAVDADLRPTDSTVRIETGGSFTGTGWYHFSSEQAECRAFTAREGIIDYQIPIPAGPFPFCSHAVIGDAWMLAAVAPRQDGERRTVQLLTSTLNKQGATGPGLATKDYGVEYVGKSTVETPAGSFSVIHLRSGEVLGTGPQALAEAEFQYEIWVTDDQYKLGVLSMYRGRKKYELQALDRSEEYVSGK